MLSYFTIVFFVFSWDNAYLNENEHYDKEGLEGEVWFGEASLNRILKWRARNDSVIPTSHSILDIGK